MYTEFYNLKEKPFDLTPSSRFLYLGEVHKEALALLKYGVSERKGFTLLTGEVGTGKTTMIHALLAGLGSNAQYVHLSNPLLSQQDFLDYLALSVLKKKVAFKSKTEFLLEFEEFLKNCLQHQKTFILIIDEAHKLSFELLEEIRLLSNMETADEKLINIFLAGQPELNEKLRHPSCRALLQRISTRYHIRPLNLQGTQEYIINRLNLAGAKDEYKIFSKEVIKAIYYYSKGFPRMINILGDNVLLFGYARGTKKIHPAMVKECYEDLQLENFQLKSPNHESPQPAVGKRNDIRNVRQLKWVAVFFVLMAIAGWMIIQYRGHIIPQLAPFAPWGRQASADIRSAKRLEVKRKIDRKIDDIIKKNAINEQVTYPIEPKDLSLNKFEEPEISVNGSEETPLEKTVIVKEGETLMELAVNAYGRSDEKILNLIQTHNPEIKDINLIEVGQKIVFPPLSEENQGPTFSVHIGSYKPFENARKSFLTLLEQGYEAYIIPVQSSQEGKIFRITLGNFETQQEGEEYAEEILRKKVSGYAKVIQLQMR